MIAARHNLFQQWTSLTSTPMRLFSRAKLVSTGEVKLAGKFLPCSQPDMPTMIWLPEIAEQAENFEKFFSMPNTKIRSLRNIWLLNYRNQGGSDHCNSYDMDVSLKLLTTLGNDRRHHPFYGLKVNCDGNHRWPWVWCQGSSSNCDRKHESFYGTDSVRRWPT